MRKDRRIECRFDPTGDRHGDAEEREKDCAREGGPARLESGDQQDAERCLRNRCSHREQRRKDAGRNEFTSAVYWMNCAKGCGPRSRQRPNRAATADRNAVPSAMRA
jgi:hypothetical protein